MLTAEKLLIAAGVGRSVYSRWRMQHIMSSVVMVAMLAVTAAVLMGGLIMGGIYALYMIALGQGLQPLSALLLVAVAALVLAAVLISTIRRQVSSIRNSMSAPMGDAMDAFLDGLFSK